jgi:holo-[acyl-carrier protein] synthase
LPAVGIDVVSIGRLERALERRPALAERLFTAAELESCAARKRPARHLAARFSAKEAVVKSLDLRVFIPTEIELKGGRQSPLTVELRGRAAQRAAELGVGLSVSVTHDGDVAAAIALAAPL